LETPSSIRRAAATEHRLQAFHSAQQRPGFIAMTPEDHTAAIHALQNAISEIKAILNNGIRTMVMRRSLCSPSSSI
jgi:hypothetical protein